MLIYANGVRDDNSNKCYMCSSGEHHMFDGNLRKLQEIGRLVTFIQPLAKMAAMWISNKKMENEFPTSSTNLLFKFLYINSCFLDLPCAYNLDFLDGVRISTTVFHMMCKYS